ncbi:YdeI/OmpD-associated family protein [Sabulilitoribacter multivorans]|uniref:YdeI/OmpD-associated family protein n=1 Tax=Flaviramulus multivorans TaxID=1304750 RepID=A0ABS9ILM0_9FLAO|nr:DUF1801 domain-containing protein [Flaviramulus multivorans]MCF7561498.1 YdeI/OmpD-associated family protein [Flaviramulus multivorans]
MNAKVDTFLSNVDKWQKELTLLRHIILDCGLTEDYKWMHPCYTYNNKNVVLIHGFKEYCAILFPKGVLLKDTEDILVQQTENVQAARQIRFTNSNQIESLKSTLKAYIFEAIEVEKSGVKVKMKKTSDFNMPEELQEQFKENPELKKAFDSLTPGRQKGYLLFFSKPKQSATRTSRIIKNTDKILNGKGLNDCVCGLSKRFPICDGSHKSLE